MAVKPILDKFKYMLASMSIPPKKYKLTNFMKEMSDFYNYLNLYGINPINLKPDTLWELKDIYDIIIR